MADVALITGGTGLIGEHVLQQWAVEGLRPVIVNRVDDDLLKAGTATALVERLRPAVVLHLAWTASGTPGYRSDPNNEAWVEASLEFDAACRTWGAWLLATGTPLDSLAHPSDAYSRSKARLRIELRSSVDAGLCTWLRPYYVVDPVRRRPALVDQAVEARDSGEPLALMTPDSEHDFVHAADVGAAIIQVLRHQMRGEVSIGSGELRRVRDLVSALGAKWTPAAQVTNEPPQHQAAADIQPLLDHGWLPSYTKEMFHDG